MKGLVIPHDKSEPIRELEVPGDGGSLAVLQAAVGGDIEALPLPEHADKTERATGYVHGEGKYAPWTDEAGNVQEGLPVNWRATDFMVPGVGLFMGDYIAGDFVLLGFNPDKGTHTETLPADVVRRARRIEKEAG